MAKKPAKRQKVTDWKGTKWVLNNLTDAQLDEAEALEFDAERFAEFLDVLVEKEGLEFKFGWDAYSDCYQATLYGAWKGFPNEGYAISARSDRGFVDAVLLLAFKFDAICNRDMAAHYEKPETNRKRG